MNSILKFKKKRRQGSRRKSNERDKNKLPRKKETTCLDSRNTRLSSEQSKLEPKKLPSEMLKTSNLKRTLKNSAQSMPVFETTCVEPKCTREKLKMK